MSSEDTPNTATYNVQFRVWADGSLGLSDNARVIIGATSNHVTTLGDIPSIIAVARGLNPADVVIMSADCVRLVDALGVRR